MRTGRPRDAMADERILTVAAAQLRERAYGGLSVDEVAARAGVAKTTVYRRWPSKAHLTLAVIERLLGSVPVPATGDPLDDLTELVAGIARALSGLGAELVAGLAAAAATDPALGAQIHALWRERRAAAAARLHAAMADGRLATRTDPELRLDLLVGPLYYRLLITGDPLDDDYVTALTSAALAA